MTTTNTTPHFTTDSYSSSCPGVTEIRTCGHNVTHHFDHVGNACQLIQVGARTYLANAVVDALGADRFGRTTIKYGPGGRRIYVLVNEELVDAILAHNEYMRCHAGARDLARRDEVNAFALMLMGYLA